MLQNILKKKNCRVLDHVENWQDAVHAALAPLLAEGACDERYEQAVFDNTEKYGAYYVLTDDMALIHASNEADVYNTQMAVTILKQPVQFTTDGPGIRILIALCAKDNSSHMEGMMAVATIFGDDGNVGPLLEAKDSESIYDVFMQAAEKNA